MSFDVIRLTKTVLSYGYAKRAWRRLGFLTIDHEDFFQDACMEVFRLQGRSLTKSNPVAYLSSKVAKMLHRGIDKEVGYREHEHTQDHIGGGNSSTLGSRSQVQRLPDPFEHTQPWVRDLYYARNLTEYARNANTPRHVVRRNENVELQSLASNPAIQEIAHAWGVV